MSAEVISAKKSVEKTVEKTMEVIELQHREVNEIIPIIKPFLNSGDRISGMRNQLIVKTSPETLTQIKNIIQGLDKALHRLSISVKYARETQQARDDSAFSGKATITRTAKDADKDRVKAQGDFSARITRTQSDEDKYSTQQIQVMEGHWASFSIGQLTPVTTSSVNVSGVATSLQTETRYKKTGTGFRVLPTVHNKHVTLKIAPHYSKPDTIDKRKTDFLSAQTEITGELGKWLDIGGTSISINQDPKSKHYSSKRSFSDERRIWVKVDMIDVE